MKVLLLKTILFSIIFTLGFNGCSTRYHGATLGERATGNDGAEFTFTLNSVVIIDHNLQKAEVVPFSKEHDIKSKLSVENLGIKTLSTRNAEVFTTIRNRTDYNLQLEIRSQFYDNNQVALEKPSAWKRYSLAKNSVITYKEQSISIDNVTQFLIEVREGE